MSNKLSPRKFLSIVMWFIAAHSAAVGLGLIILPNTAMGFLGFESSVERFFQTQGGVFHLVMAVAYGLAAKSKSRRGILTEFAVIAKFMATIFLCSYYLFVEKIWIVIMSAAGDCLLGVLILLTYLRWKRYEREVNYRPEY